MPAEDAAIIITRGQFSKLGRSKQQREDEPEILSETRGATASGLVFCPNRWLALGQTAKSRWD